MGTRHEGYDSVRAAILGAAAELFTRTGVHGTSLNDIASAAGLAKGTLYYYYPAKDELVADVAREHDAYMTDALLTWISSLERDSDIREALSSLLSALLSDAMRRKLHIVLFAESCLDDPMLSALTSAMLEKWTVMLEVGAIKPQSREARLLRTRSRIFFSLLTGFMLRSEISAADRQDFISVLIG